MFYTGRILSTTDRAHSHVRVYTIAHIFPSSSFFLSVFVARGICTHQQQKQQQKKPRFFFTIFTDKHKFILHIYQLPFFSHFRSEWKREEQRERMSPNQHIKWTSEWCFTDA